MAKWSISEAMNAVKVAFFERPAEGEGVAALRYTEIRDAIRSWRSISDRTLSKALRDLRARGELRKNGNGAYELNVQLRREDLPPLILAADIISINAGAAVGLVGNQKGGWTFYGVSKGKPRGLRSQLEQAAIGLQNRVDGILLSEARQIVCHVLRRAHERGLPNSKARAIRRMAMKVFEEVEIQRVGHLDAFVWTQVMERLFPGALPRLMERMLKPPLGVQKDINSGVPVHVSMTERSNEWVPYLARVYQEDVEALRKAWPRLTQEARAGAEAFESLRKAVLAKDWRKFQRHWSIILAARYWICGVIR